MQHRKVFCIWCAIIALSLLVAAARSEEPKTNDANSIDARPHILFVFTDDQAPWAVGASGNEQIKTPNMDRLFGEGAYLKNAFTVTPVCSPSRASLMTSRYGTELGITDWIKPGAEAELGLDPQTVTWPELLQQAGYKTGLVGKWHLGVPDRFHPTKTGFDYFMGFRTGGTTPNNPTLEKDGQNQKFNGLTTDILTDHAIGFLKANHNSEEPMLLCVHYRAPHARWLPVADEDWAPYDKLDPEIPNPDFPDLNTSRVKQMTREYMASVSGVDRNLGRLLTTLDELKLTDNTVVIFSSDHGYNMGHNGIWHKGNGHWVVNKPPAATKNIPRGQRPNMYDHSIRVPTAIRWPGKVKPETEITATISNLDFYPTVCAIAGVKPPEGETIRGRDFSSLLKGAQVKDWNNDFYAEYSTKHQSRTHMRMYRTPQWKLVRDFLNPERDELFNLVDDPAESNNLIASKDAQVQKTLSQLHQKIIEQMKANDDPVLKLALER